MRSAAIVAYGARSALGAGEAALGVVDLGMPATTCVAPDEALAGAHIKRSACARAAVSLVVRRRADALLDEALDACIAELDRGWPGWRDLRLGLALGTSSGAMDGASRAYEALARGEPVAPEDAYDLAYGAPFARARARLASTFVREVHVLGACASSTLALGLGALWLDADACDLVLAGGYDAVTAFVASGFAALGAVTADVPRPFRAGRDGLALGEGAAVVALAREPRGARAFVTGFGAASDAVHLTAPDRDARSLVGACRRALASASIEPGDVGLVSAHGTSTSYNDAAEARAFGALFGAREPVVHALKGQVGHTLGAAGALETLSLAVALERGIAPATAGRGDVDPDARVRLVDASEATTAAHGLKTSLAFGGLDAALVVSTRASDEAARARVASRESDAVEIDEADADPEIIAARTHQPVERVARQDLLCRLVVAAVAEVCRRFDVARGADVAVIVGHDVATIATNAEYAKRLALGRAPEPRRFPYTSPNACAGEASIALGLVGPAFAVGGAPGMADQARAVARDLVEGGLVEAAIAIEVHERSIAADHLSTAWCVPSRPAFARAAIVRRQV